VLVLPESFRPDSGPGMLDSLAARGYQIETVPMRRHQIYHSTSFGRGWRPAPGIWCLAVASRLPVLERRELQMGKAFHDPTGPRRALQISVDCGGRRVEVVGLHTSSKLWWAAPIVHMAHVRRELPRGPEPAVVAGDFNFWGPGVVATVRGGWKRAVRGRSWPAHRPHSQIDHILVNSAVTVLESEVLPAFGSDHRAVRARLAV